MNVSRPGFNAQGDAAGSKALDSAESQLESRPLTEPPGTSAEITIRHAGRGDLDAIDRLESGAFQADRFARRNLRRLLASRSARVLIAELGTGPAGYALLLFRKGSRVARLYSIAVAERVRGCGVGSRLLAACEGEAAGHGASILRLEVRASNQTAIGTYARAGFQQSGRHPAYYPDAEDAVIMEKTIGTARTGSAS